MTFLYIIIALVFVFDFINGFHDSANSIATVVATKVLTPVQAVLFAAFFNFIAFLFFELHVAKTIGKGIVDPEVISLTVIASGLVGAIVWNLLTWWWGIPSSSSHALIGGLAGAALFSYGPSSVVWPGIFKVLAFIVLAPLIGMVIAVIISVIVINIFRRSAPYKVDNYFRRLQLLSAALFSIGHGGNDAQKSMGIILVAMIVSGALPKDAAAPPDWAVIGCYSAMGLGTLFGGWKIVKTMGDKITKLKPFEGFCAETAGAVTLFGASAFGIPVSTTHTITGSIFGVGSLKRASAVNWGLARTIFQAWILTIPASALVAGLTYLILNQIVK